MIPLQLQAQAELEKRRRARVKTCSDKYYYQTDYAGFAAQRLKIQTKAKQLVALVYNPVQRDLMSHLTGRDLVLKARQHGVSTCIQGWLYQAAVTGTATTMTLAHNDDSTQTLRRIADRFHMHDPAQPQRGKANDRLATYPQYDSEALIATAGNKTSGRSTTLTHLHGSEVAFWLDAASVMSSALQAGNPWVVLESTPNGAQGYFYSLCMEALDGNSAWVLHFYPWWVEADYQVPLDPDECLTYTGEEQALAEKHQLTPEQIKWRRGKQRDLKHLFPQEYPEDTATCFLQSGFGYFGDVSAALKAPLGPTPQADHYYVAGLDFGQTQDYTALHVADLTARCQVDLLRVNNLPWAEMRRRVVERCQRWRVRLLMAEGNSMGATNIEELRKELRTAGVATRVQVFQTSNETKADIMGNLYELLHSSGYQMQPIPEQTHELNAFVATQLPSGAWRLAASGTEHDDTVIGAALAAWCLVDRGWSDDDIAAIGSGTINWANIGPDLLAAMRASGVDVDALMKKE